MSYFPDGPYDVRATAYFKAIFGFVACIAWAVLFGWFGITLVAPKATALLHEADVWEHGVAATEGGYEGTGSTSRFVFHEYKLNVDYTDEEGEEHHRPLE